jgi:hypothetical protein
MKTYCYDLRLIDLRPYFHEKIYGVQGFGVCGRLTIVDLATFMMAVTDIVLS